MLQFLLFHYKLLDLFIKIRQIAELADKLLHRKK